MDFGEKLCAYALSFGVLRDFLCIFWSQVRIGVLRADTGPCTGVGAFIDDPYEHVLFRIAIYFLSG